MFSLANFTFVLSFIYLLKIAQSTDKLNVPRVLLPVFKDFSVNYTLEITGNGCYRWSTPRPDLIGIEQVYKIESSCSKHVTIKVLSKKLTKKTSLIIAEDPVRGQTLLADVIIDVISYLKVITKSRELCIDCPPQMFEVRAYDNAGNEFTTLEGVEFKWTILDAVDSPISPAMRLLTFAESPYETPQSVAAFDRIGKQGHIALLEGIHTGSAHVAVRLPHVEYESIRPAMVELLVIPSLLLEPSYVNILPGDIVGFQLFQIYQGKQHIIAPSDKQFILLSRNEDIATVDNRIVTGLKVGKVEIMVLDTHTKYNGTIKLPSAFVVVAEPHFMSLLIFPFNLWFLTVAQEATIVPEIFTIDNEKIWVGKNTLINISITNDIFEIHSKNINGTVTGIASKEGVGQVSAVVMNRRTIELKTEKTLTIYPPVHIYPKVLILPWVPNYTSILSDFSFSVTGGDLYYVWASANTSIVEVTQSGVLKFIGPGSSTVTVFMKRNENIKAFALVHLLTPEEISFYEDVNEAIVGDDIYLHISLYGLLENGGSNETVLFNSCLFLDFVVSAEHPFQRGADPIDVDPKAGACAVKTIKTTAVGAGMVTVCLDTNNGKLCSTASVAAHRPLIALEPAENEITVLALGSSYDIVFSGGPRPIFGQITANSSFSEGQIQSETVITRPELYVYRITCLQIGEASFELQILSVPLGSIAGLKAIKSVSINCKVPKNFEIIGSSKPACSEMSPKWFISYRVSKVRFDVKIYDEKGSVFKNATSLLFKWSFNNRTLASFDDDKIVLLEEKIQHEYKSPITHYVTAKTFSTLGDVKATGSIIGYKRAVTSRLSIDKSNYAKTEEIFYMLSIVRESSVEPNFLSLFNDPNNFGLLKITGGSGHFSFEPTSPIVSVNYNYKTRTAEIVPINDGGGEIIVTDKCLSEVFPPRVQVNVISVASVKIYSEIKVQEGQLIKVIVRVFDKDDNLLYIPKIHYSKLGLQMEVSNLLVADFEGRIGEANIEYVMGTFEIYLIGKKIGETSICARWKGIPSNVVTVEVFPKIKITPRSLTLAVGSEIQVKVAGGPLSDAYTHFVISDPSIISVSSDSAIKGIRPGNTLVTAASMGYQGEVYSSDTIEVGVVRLTGVHIVAPTTKLGLGNSMPVYASGIPHEISPLLLGSISPSLQFKWQFSVPNIIQIRDTLFNTKMQVSNENKLSVRVFALNPGHTSLELLVSGVNPDNTNFSFSCTLVIEVFNKLKWTKPDMEFSHMLMAPNTAYYLGTNTLEKEFKTIQVTDLWNFDSGQPLLNVLPDGLIKSGSNFGSAVIAAKTIGADISFKEIVLAVMVQPVHYLMINIDTVLETSEEVTSLPRGLYLNMTISYHDQYGYEFFVPPNSKPVFECNIGSKVHIEYSGSNHSIITSLASAGNIILRIRDVIGQTEMEDYIKIPVDNFIVPGRLYLTAGEIICYWTPLISTNGVWSTDNKNIIINNDGVAFAEKTGSTTVSYSISSDPTILASLSVEILPFSSFLIGPVSEQIVTNVVGSDILVPVFLINAKQRKEPNYSKNCPTTKINISTLPFVCEIHYTSASKLYPIDRIFSVKSAFDNQMGSYVCMIIPIKGAAKETSTIESNITLSVTNHKTSFETLFLNFNPQFFVNVDRIYFSRDIATAPIKISGSTNVLNSIFIETSGHKFISVRKPYEETSQTMSFVVSAELPEDKIFLNEDYHILITCSLTMQKEKIPIIFNYNEGGNPFSINLFSLLSRILLFLMRISLDGLLFNNVLLSFVIYGIISVKIYFGLSKNYDYDSFEEMVLKNEEAEDESRNHWYFRYNSGDRPLLASPNFLKLSRRDRKLI